MATTVTLNGTQYSIPAPGESRTWGSSLSAYLIAISTTTVQKTGGNFTLTADLNLGASKGLISVYYKTYSANLAQSGILRLANDESVAWRNAANAADKALKVNASDRLEYDGVVIPTLSSSDTLTNKTLTSPVMTSPALGTVASGNIANTTGYAAASLSGLGTGVATWLATPSSANLAGAVTDETGSGALVFGTAPTLDKPVINQADVTQGASATTPAAGKSAIYVNSGDSKLHVVDSSGNDVAVGSGSSGRNYMGDWYDAAKDIGTVTNSLGDTLSSSDRTANKTTWGSSNTSLLTIARSTNSELRQTYNYLITEAGSSSGAFIEGPLFTLDQVDIGKPVSVSFDLKGNTTDGDYQAYIVRYNASNILQSRVVIAGNASTTSPNSAKLPTGTTTFNGFFVPDSTTTTDQYAVRIVSNNSSAASIRIDTIFIGPQPIRVGAAITDWQSYTPTVSNLGTGSGTSLAYWRRNGGNLELHITFTKDGSGGSGGAGVTFSIPTGLTIDSALIGSVRESVGIAYSTTATITTSTVARSSTPTVVSLGVSGGGDIPGSTFTAASVWSFNASVPIVGWSSNVTMADRAVEEYCSNSDVTSTSSVITSGSISGIDGTIISSSWTVGTGYTRNVDFSTAYQPTDTVILELKDNNRNWVPAQALFPPVRQSSNNFGIQWYTTSANPNRVIVEFGAGGQSPSNATYASNGTAWSALNAAGWRWRVRKVSGGAQVGYPISSANIVGRVDGNAPATGMVGEQIRSQVGATTVTSAAVTNLTTISLTAGIWDISAAMYCNGTTVTEAAISISGTSTTHGTLGDNYLGYSLPAGFASHALSIPQFRVTLSGSATYYLIVQVTGTGTVQARGRISAVRIA